MLALQSALVNVMHAEGSNGSVTLADDKISIRHKGFANFLTQGAHGEKQIPIENITAIQFKAAGFMAGYIQFSMLGGVDRPGGVMEATKDENAVLFDKKQQVAFEKLKTQIESRIRELKSKPVAAQRGVPDLDRLIELYEKNLLSEEEFRAAKKALLGL